MACEIVSPSNAVLDHWVQAGSDNGFRRDTTANQVLKGVFSSVFKTCAPHMVALGNCSGVDLVVWAFKTLRHPDQTLT